MKRLYVIAIILGVILTPVAHKIATAQRGYTAIGGEILLVPLFLLILVAKDQVKDGIEEFREIFKEEQEEERKCTKQKAQNTTRC